MSSCSCPVFTPSYEEFRNFPEYIRKIEPIAIEYGMCKIIPPSGWLMHRITRPEEAFGRVSIPVPIKQYISGRSGIFSMDLVEVQQLDIRQFYEIARRASSKFISLGDNERAFWKSLTPVKEPPIYGADVLGTLFEENDGGDWNLNNLSTVLQQLLGRTMGGITTPMLYFGMWRAMFAFHTEDMNLYSINYLHYGAEKSWYTIPSKFAQRFESFMQSYFPSEYQQCHEFLRHKRSIVSPLRLREQGIPFHTAVQSAGEFMITFPQAYHAGFNHGFNIAESTNFGSASWIPFGRKAKICMCRPFAARINMDEFEKLVKNTTEERDDENKTNSEDQNENELKNLNSDNLKENQRKRKRNSIPFTIGCKFSMHDLKKKKLIEGRVVDITDGSARIHLKGERREQDYWISINELQLFSTIEENSEPILDNTTSAQTSLPIPKKKKQIRQQKPKCKEIALVESMGKKIDQPLDLDIRISAEEILQYDNEDLEKTKRWLRFVQQVINPTQGQQESRTCQLRRSVVKKSIAEVLAITTNPKVVHFLTDLLNERWNDSDKELIRPRTALSSLINAAIEAKPQLRQHL